MSLIDSLMEVCVLNSGPLSDPSQYQTANIFAALGKAAIYGIVTSTGMSQGKLSTYPCKVPISFLCHCFQWQHVYLMVPDDRSYWTSETTISYPRSWQSFPSKGIFHILLRGRHSEPGFTISVLLATEGCGEDDSLNGVLL